MKKLILLVAIIPLLFSCSKKWHGCTDDVATNFNINAEKQDDSCVYTRLTFYADSSQYPSSPVDHIDIQIGGTSLGTFATVYSIGGLINCGANGTTSYIFEDAGGINWNARVFLINGTVLTKTGSIAPDPNQTCILISTL
ncbi:MAG: hypothetical protein JKX68_04600 [Flavobacteriales bacterium]|nr:hypothetical protein [Flavobacteriales bacterium]